MLDTQSISKNINNRCNTQQKTRAASGGSRGKREAEAGGERERGGGQGER